ncbi:MAG: hypothetical protein FJZ87_05685 [Chloroflexi bacterium]|nr:hypothetical protein [Chloroflexota bacterium]
MNSFLTTGLFFLFLFLSGFWLSRSGKPYGAGIFNIHKLIGLALGVFLIVTVYRTHQTAPLESTQIAVVAVTVTIFIGLIAAGGLLSVVDAGNLPDLSRALHKTIETVHHWVPYLAVFATAATLYLLLIRGV